MGHAGTLDPFATGLLVILVGRATRLARFVERQAKTYLATARLGVRTTTDDLTGDPLGGVPSSAEAPSRAAVEAALRSFLGAGQQRPPTFSAKHVGGERSYAKARRGESVDLAEAAIEVHEVELVGYDFPDLRFRATVSAGTYLRALARDLGELLGTGAHLRELRREAIGALRVSEAVSLDRVGPDALLPPLGVLGHLPRVDVSETEASALAFGRAITPVSGGPREAEAAAAVANGDRLVAVGRMRDGVFQPEVVLEAAN